VSKTPAKKATARKSAPSKKSAPTVKNPAKHAMAAKHAAPAKPVAKHAAKPAPKSRPAAAKPPPAKAKASAKTAAKAPVKTPSPKTPIKAHAKSVTTPLAVKPAAKPAAPVKPTAVATPAPAPRKSGGRGGSKYGVAPAQAPLPLPTSRFADRFAPPRPPTRQMNNLELDTPKPTQKADPKLTNAWKSKAGRDLSEAEMLAMPDSEYMNDKQLEFFRVKLQTLKDDLLSNAGETTEHLREDTSIVPDPADRATIEEEHALELRTRDRERKLLKKISQSLGRIESGDYGFCDETGEPIGLGRLIARPTATLSLEAQQRRELKQKMFGD
jgi:DnaK suppressor protein